MQARKHGWQLQVTPLVNFEDGIEAMRYVFPRFRIDKMNCSLGIRALREYQRVYDETTKAYSKKPLDNWSVHIADAFRYLSTNYKRLYDFHQPPSTYSSSM